MVKKVPNILSASRIVFAASLLFLTKQPTLFVFSYAVCGITDSLDGFIARRYNCASDLGAKLDTIADNLFMGITLITVFFIMKLVQFEKYLVICLSIIVGMRLFNFLLTKIKFKQWHAMHTLANKFIGVPIFFAIPFCVMANTVPKNLIVAFVVGIGLISLEETVILFSLKEYDPNTKSIFHVKDGLNVSAAKEDIAA